MRFSELNVFCGDSAYTFCVGEVSDEVKQLLKVTKEALYLGIEQAVQGKRLGDLGYAIQTHCEHYGYGVVREFVGHGIGKEMHEDPHGLRPGAQIRDSRCRSRRCGEQLPRDGDRIGEAHPFPRRDYRIALRKN